MAATPKTARQFVMFAVMVAITLAIIFRVPQIRTVVTGS
jgi:hypothetical protein